MIIASTTMNDDRNRRSIMAPHIEGPLYYERMGREGPVIAFVHPNPMDQSCWIFQMAHLSTWYRCIAIDIPGYGRSPKATAGLTMDDMAAACWEAIDDAFRGETAILAGCSVGSSILPWMHHQRPGKTAALVLSGTGYNPKKEFAQRRIEAYTKRGIGYRWDYTFEDLSPAFRATPLAHFFADMFAERNDSADPGDHPAPIRGAGETRARGPFRAGRLPRHHPHRQRGRRPSKRLRAASENPRLRPQGATRRRPRLSDRAALAVRSLYARFPEAARAFSRAGVITAA
jgi:pimeloyl-ACP methyl ester carboxylesterase